MLGSAAKADLANYHEKIWPIVGTALKLGALEDYKNQAKLLKLLRFHSSSSSGETTSLDEYIAKRKQGQTQIYYIAGAGMERKDLEKSPFVENIQARGYEVLYFTVSNETIKRESCTFTKLMLLCCRNLWTR